MHQCHLSCALITVWKSQSESVSPDSSFCLSGWFNRAICSHWVCTLILELHTEHLESYWSQLLQSAPYDTVRFIFLCLILYFSVSIFNTNFASVAFMDFLSCFWLNNILTFLKIVLRTLAQNLWGCFLSPWPPGGAAGPWFFKLRST